MVIGLVILSYSSNAHATLVDNGITTVDTDTGLEWLDLTETYDMTVAQVIPELAPAGLFAGYRLAVIAEVHELMTNAGLPVSTIINGIVSTDIQDIIEANALTALLGNTITPQYGSRYIGARGHLIDGNQDRVVGFYSRDQSNLYHDYFTGQPHWPGTGVWLVRSVDVPEPGPFALIILGLAGFVFAGRYRR